MNVGRTRKGQAKPSMGSRVMLAPGIRDRTIATPLLPGAGMSSIEREPVESVYARIDRELRSYAWRVALVGSIAGLAAFGGGCILGTYLPADSTAVIGGITIVLAVVAHWLLWR